MEDSATKTIVLLGKTGVGKSSLANTILTPDTEHFKINDTFNSETKHCNVLSGNVNGRSITLIDTPGFFDTDMPEQELRSEILKCVTKCASGIHAFLILLEMKKVTEHEEAVIKRIFEYFSDDVLKYCVLVFTHGNQIPDGKEIKELVSENPFLNDLMKKCGDRCLAFDNKYWKEKPKEKYRSNKFQVESLLQTIDEMVTSNNRDCYTNEMLQAAKEEIQQEQEKIRLLPGNLSESKIREQAELHVFEKLLIRFAGTATGVFLGAFFGVVVMVGSVKTLVEKTEKPVQLKDATSDTVKIVGPLGAGGTAVGAKIGGKVGTAVIGTPTAVALGIPAVVGAMRGLKIGWDSADGAATAKEAAKKAAEAVRNEAQAALDSVCEWNNKP